MATIDEILKEAKFAEWRGSEQRALSSMIHHVATKQSIESIVDKTDRVNVTFIKILDTHLPTAKEHDIEEV